MRSVERRKGIVLEMKCLRSSVGVSRIDRVMIKEKGSQPTTCDHINKKYIWGPHVTPYEDPTLITNRFAKSVQIK